MAKQRRQPRPSRKTARDAVTLAAPAPPAPAPRASYLEAVTLFEQGFTALQIHEYSRAAALFRSVLSDYPDEKELHERVRLYLNTCERHLAADAHRSPATPEERIVAATVAFNEENYAAALEYLRAATRTVPDHDHAFYLLATVLAARDETDDAVASLLRAIELNPENRALARQDPDLKSILEDDRVRAALDAAAPEKPARIERRKLAKRA